VLGLCQLARRLATVEARQLRLDNESWRKATYLPGRLPGEDRLSVLARVDAWSAAHDLDTPLVGPHTARHRAAAPASRK